MTALLKGLFTAPFRALWGTSVTCRRARPDEVIDVRHRVLRVGRPRETALFDGDAASTTRHWVAAEGQRVIGCVSVMETDGLQLRGMAILEEYQGRGVGGALLQQVHNDVNASMWCNARERAVPFYARHGWVVDGERFEISPIGPHFKMRWSPQ